MRFPNPTEGAAREAGLIDSTFDDPRWAPAETAIPLSEACDLVMHMHKTAEPRTVRKFLIGVALHGNESGICGYAERFEESYVRLDRSEVAPYLGEPESFSPIPADFWRIGMAISEGARASFAANNLTHETELTASELPYRMRDQTTLGIQNERVRLTQLAWGVYFPRQRLIAIAEDPKWQAWGDVALTLRDRGMRGRPKVWKWDEVKVALTIEAAQNPEILRKGPGVIVQFINDELRHRHYEQIPDRKEVDAYVQRFSALWEPPELGPPVD